MNKEQIKEYREKLNNPSYVTHAINSLADLIVEELYTPRVKIEKTKLCVSCGKIKNIVEFPNKNGNSNGHSFCKECMAKRQRTYRKKNHKKINKNT